MTQRLEFVTLARQPGVLLSALCKQFGISRPTAYKWLERFANDGRDGLVGRSRRPHLSPGQTAADVETAVVAIRDANPEIVKHPNGPILHGAGQGSHNLPWSWHLDPEETMMAEASIEVCDGRPSYVEGEVDEFVDVVEAYCPWGAELVEVQDFRTAEE